jgi:hypothetical protein
MNWKKMNITELEAMEILERIIDNMVETLPNAADGCHPIGKCYLDSLMYSKEKGKWYIWYNDLNESSGIVYEK